MFGIRKIIRENERLKTISIIRDRINQQKIEQGRNHDKIKEWLNKPYNPKCGTQELFFQQKENQVMYFREQIYKCVAIEHELNELIRKINNQQND